MKICVIFVDDYVFILIGMCYLLSVYDDLWIVVQVQDVDGLLVQFEVYFCDLLIIDLMMFGSQQVDGLCLVQKVWWCYLDLLIIVVIMFGNLVFVLFLFKLGIYGLVSKCGMFDDLFKVICYVGC